MLKTIKFHPFSVGRYWIDPDSSCLQAEETKSARLPFEAHKTRKFSLVSRKREDGWWEIRVSKYAHGVDIGPPLFGPVDYQQVFGDRLNEWFYWPIDGDITGHVREVWGCAGVNYQRSSNGHPFVPAGVDKAAVLRTLANFESVRYCLNDRPPADNGEHLVLGGGPSATSKGIHGILSYWGTDLFPRVEPIEDIVEYLFPFTTNPVASLGIDVTNCRARFSVVGYGDDGEIVAVCENGRRVNLRITGGALSEPEVVDLSKQPNLGVADLFRGVGSKPKGG